MTEPGTEHFVKSIKTIIYKVFVSNSCLEEFRLFPLSTDHDVGVAIGLSPVPKIAWLLIQACPLITNCLTIPARVGTTVHYTAFLINDHTLCSTKIQIKIHFHLQLMTYLQKLILNLSWNP